MVSSSLEMDPCGEERLKLEIGKAGSSDSCNFYLAGCLAHSVTDVLSR